ncbi:MAG: DUF3667 domain-containing protein [Steroidobacteraceae bacterium]
MSSPAAPAEAAPAAGIAAAMDVAAQAAGVSAAAAPPAAGTIRCANCGTPLTGKYCSDCGQRHHDVPVHHFWHFVGEAFEDLTHADSRLWQTLIALLFRPGFLTREFLEGHRARYLPPVRLYLVVSVIFFIIAGLQSRISTPQIILVSNGKGFKYQVLPADKARARAAVGQAPARSRDGAATGLAAIAATAAGRQHICEQSGTFIEQHAGWLSSLGPRVARNCVAVLAQSGGVERLNEAITENLERAMFLFLPLLALAMKPLYLKPPRHYVEHLLFFLHNHAFVFVMLGVESVLEMSTSSAAVLGLIKWAIAIYILVYFYRAMRRVYDQGRWLTLSKLAALAVAYFLLGMLMFMATVSYSFLML